MKMSLVLVASMMMVPFGVMAEAPVPSKEFRKTLNAASQEKKLAFLLVGRPSCSNCNATKKMIQEGRIPVTAEEFVMGDLNIDDSKTYGDFTKKFRKETFGDTLPLVVITDSTGKALATSSGYKQPEQWAALIAEAKTSATPRASAGPAGGDPNWPFKTAPKK